MTGSDVTPGQSTRLYYGERKEVWVCDEERTQRRAWPCGADRPPQAIPHTAPSCRLHVPPNHAVLREKQVGNDESPEEVTCARGTSTKADAEMELGVKEVYRTQVGYPCKVNVRVE